LLALFCYVIVCFLFLICCGCSFCFVVFVVFRCCLCFMCCFGLLLCLIIFFFVCFLFVCLFVFVCFVFVAYIYIYYTQYIYIYKAARGRPGAAGRARAAHRVPGPRGHPGREEQLIGMLIRRVRGSKENKQKNKSKQGS